VHCTDLAVAGTARRKRAKIVTKNAEQGKRGNWGRFFFYRIFLAGTPDI
jgi:hypothetical protein